MNKQYSRIWARPLILAAALAGVACAPQESEEAAEATDPKADMAPVTQTEPSPAGQTESSDDAPGDEPDFDSQLAMATQDLATRLGIPEQDITALEARAVHWPSGALGCPQKGMNYTQAIVPGMLFLLEANGSTYRYHAGMTGQPRHCPDSQAQAPAYGTGEAVM